MDPQALNSLEFHEVLAMLRERAMTPRGASLALLLAPASEPAVVVREVELTAEASRHLDSRGVLPFGVLADVDPPLARLGVEGSILESLQILDLLAMIKTGRALRMALGTARSESPHLWEMGRGMPELGNLVRYLDGRIASSGEFEDNASDDLRSIRQDLQRRNERLNRLLASISSRPEVSRALQDDFVSIRSDRHVIPIRTEARTSLPGIVHGVSGSGATVFMEPMETVELNNEIVTLRERESAETNRLLREYTDLLRGRRAEMVALWNMIGHLDLIMARALLGRALRAVSPDHAPEAGIVLEGARHPLVERSVQAAGGRMVPLDLALETGTTVLVVSGPNTGGKTVALKTVGLLAAMHQSGIPVPADRAVLPIFSGIFIDIGDRQSIADSLSTFSARIETAATIARNLTPPALVLLDEIGTGTDPEEGVAIGTSILDDYRQKGATVIATTHLEAIKAYAAGTEGCTNAAMQFDEKTFRPTFRLVLGVPGRSGALEIAERIGLPRSILDAARARRGRSMQIVEDYLVMLQEMSADLEAKLRDVSLARENLDSDRRRFEEELRDRGERQRAAVAEEIALAFQSMREEGKRYLATIRDREIAARLRRAEEKAAASLRSVARDLTRRVTGGSAHPVNISTEEISPGHRVRIEGMGVSGSVQEILGSRVVVLVRGKRLTVPIEDCRSDLPGGTPTRRRGPKIPSGVTLRRTGPGEGDVPPELHLRGLRVEDALVRVDKYLDNASLAGLETVRLVHGVGSGRLRRAIIEFLDRHPHVQNSAGASMNEGGAGVTVVTIRG